MAIDAPLLAVLTSFGDRSLSSPGQGSHARPPVMVNPLPSTMDTPNSHSTPPMLTPVGRWSLQPSSGGTSMLPRLTPKPLASLGTPPPQGQEEDMDSEPQEGPESQQ